MVIIQKTQLALKEFLILLVHRMHITIQIIYRSPGCIHPYNIVQNQLCSWAMHWGEVKVVWHEAGSD